MNNFHIAGIQGIGINADNLSESRKWYADMFQMDVNAIDDVTTAQYQYPHTEEPTQQRHLCITLNLQGGGGFEMLQSLQQTQESVSFDMHIGDLGINAAKIKSHNIAAYHEELSSKYKDISSIVTDPRGLPTFYLHDPFGNCFQVVEDNYVFLDENRYSGGIVGAIIGVSDLERSLPFIQKVLGYDTILYDKTGIFNDWQTLKGGNATFRRVLLKRSEQPSGPFAGLYGNSTIELVQILEGTPRKVQTGNYASRHGFLHLCFDVVNMGDFEKQCEEYGYSFIADSGPQQTLFEQSQIIGQTCFLEDSDGTLFKFVEAQKIPLIKRLDLNLNLQKMDPSKQLPELMFHLMKFNKVKFK